MTLMGTIALVLPLDTRIMDEIELIEDKND